MTTIQLKTEIQKALDQAPDEVLINVLELLKELQTSPSENIRLNKFLEQTLTEDKGLLERLAK